MLFFNSLIIFALAIPLGLGIGSGGVFLVYLSDVLSLPREVAVFLNLLFFLCALCASALQHLRERRLALPTLVSILLFGIPGAFAGRWLASLLPAVILRLLLGIFLTGSGVFALLSLKKPKEASHSLDKREKKHYNKL